MNAPVVVVLPPPHYRRTFRADARRDDLLAETLRRRCGGAVCSKARARLIKLAMLMPSWPLELCPEQRYRALAARAVRWSAVPECAAEAFLTLWRDKLTPARRAALLARVRALESELCEIALENALELPMPLPPPRRQQQQQQHQQL